jgi:hypothetical protein
MPINTSPSGGPQGEYSTYTPIYSQTLSSATSSITFSNIPTTFTDLALVVSALNATATNTSFQFRVGSNTVDTGSNYSLSEIFGTGSSAGSDRASNDTAGYLNGPGIGTSTTIPNTYVMNFMNYSNTTTFKTVLGRGGSANINLVATVNLWRSTLPINTITVFQSINNMSSGSTFTLYGIKAAISAPKALGGDSIFTDGYYWIHQFNSSSTFTPLQSLSNVDYLVVAGGGGGFGNRGGGGGGGGFRTSAGTSGAGSSAESKLSLSAQAYTVTVGAGGAAQVVGRGSDSVFSTITSTGGGAGGDAGTAASVGGSGGGGGHQNLFSGGALGTANQGRAGGNGYSSGSGAAGGGGGASAVGSNNASQNVGGAGGAGQTTYITGALTTYAGGGGGGGFLGSGGAGGTGGGGNAGYFGSANLNGVPGTANTGGGGGGGSYDGSNFWTQQNGGSGIVIVRYPV